MPSPLFDILFLAALFIPAAMYIIGVFVLMASLVIGHRPRHVEPVRSIEAAAH